MNLGSGIQLVHAGHMQGGFAALTVIFCLPVTLSDVAGDIRRLISLEGVGDVAGNGGMGPFL